MAGRPALRALRWARRGLAVVLLACGVACTPPAGEEDARAPSRETIATDAAPEAIGPYSQAIRAGNTLYLAGQIGIDPATGTLVEGGIAAETRRALENLHAVLQQAGFARTDVVRAEVFLADLDDYGAMNEAYAAFFGEHRPARAAVEVARLPRNAAVEIVLTAVRTE